MMLQMPKFLARFVLGTLDTSMSPSHLAVTGSLSRFGMRSCLRLSLRREFLGHSISWSARVGEQCTGPAPM